MINEWIRNNKKLAVIIAVGGLALLALIILLVVNVFQNSNRGEEQEPASYISISNLEVLYEDFSDYTVGYISDALMTALSTNQSMKNGKPASDESAIPKDSTNAELYSGNGTGEYTLKIEGDKVDYFEDDWGMWHTFSVSVNDGRRFKVDVAIGAHNRDNDVAYTKINITKL